MTPRVYLVGAGPGDPELLTVKAARLIASADAVVFDRLVGPDIVALIPASAKAYDVGKTPKHHPVPQSEINALLVALARAGHRVVRLKGGDPLLFGRGGEEADALAQAGIACEIVPGITAAQGASAALAVPLTDRRAAHSVTYITGHGLSDGLAALDWHALAVPETTLVVYMGLVRIAEIADALMAHGRAGATPVIAVSKATQSGQRHTIANLQTIGAHMAEAAFDSPTLFIIGEVAALSPLSAAIGGEHGG